MVDVPQNPHHQSLTFTQTLERKFHWHLDHIIQTFGMSRRVFHALPTSKEAGGMESLLS